MSSLQQLFDQYQQARERFLRAPAAAGVNECIAILDQVAALQAHPVEADIELALRLSNRARIPGAAPEPAADTHRADALLQAAAGRATVSPHVWGELGIAYRVAFQEGGQRQDADRGLALLRLAATGGSGADPDAFQQLIEHSEDIWSRTQDPADLDNVIEVYRQADTSLEGLTGDQRAWLLDQLAFRLKDRFRLSHRPADAAEALAHRRRALTLASPDSSNRAHLAFGLALCLEDEAERAKQPPLLQEARVMLSEEIGRAGPEHQAALLSRRGVAARAMYRLTGDVSNLDSAVADQQAALTAAPVNEAAHALYLLRLSNAQADRYRATGEEADLDEAVRQAVAAVAAATGQAEEDPGMFQNTLGQALGLRYERRMDAGDLAAELTAYRAAVDTARAGRGGSLGLHLNNLADKLIRHEYQRTGRVEVLGEAARLLTEAENSEPDDLAMVLNTHGLALLTRYQADDDPADLREAVSLIEKAVQITPEGAVALPTRLDNLASTLLVRAAVDGDVEALGQAVAARRRACALVAPWSHDAVNLQINLAATLTEEYHFTGRRDCLEEAENICARLPLTGPANWRATILLNSAEVLMTIGGNSGDAGPVAEAARRLTTAVPLVASGPLQARVAYDLAVVLQRQGGMTRRTDLIEQAIAALLQLLEELPDPHPVRPDAELALAVSYWMGGVLNRATAYVIAAIALADKSLSREVPGTPRWFHTALRLASFYTTPGPAPGRASELLERVIAGSPIPMQVIEAAGYLGEIRSGRGDPGGAAAAYVAGVRAMESLFDRQLVRAHQEQALREGLGLATRAAVTLATAGRLDEAVAILESGRTVLAGTALYPVQLRLEALAAAGHTDLADEYRAAAATLDGLAGGPGVSEPGIGRSGIGGSGIGGSGIGGLRGGLGMAALGAAVDPAGLRVARERLQAAIAAIAAVAGFESFPRPRPPTADELARLSAVCVYLVPGPGGGMALQVSPGKATAWCPLPGLDEDRLAERAQAWRLATQPETRSSDRWPDEIASVTRWLWTACMEQVTALTGALDEVVLIPCGHLVDLPLHAAWRPGPDGPRYLIEDLTVRYAPSLRAVLRAAAPQARTTAVPFVLADERLPHAPQEAAAVATALATGTEPRLRSQTERADILAALPGAQIAHFACHAFSSPVDPLASAIDACRDAPVTLADILGLELPAMRLAVLSACESALSSQTLPDEVINLAAGLVQAGVAGVVGSLWPVDDATTAILMKQFYELWSPGNGENIHPAAALRQVQVWMRSGAAGPAREGSIDPADPAAWAPFIYVGG
ncbi:MAG TPA: CHAT domain-containing protein [Streptosporangiaceae bacterium]